MDSQGSDIQKPKLQTRIITRAKSASSQSLSHRCKFNDELAVSANRSHNISQITNSNRSDDNNNNSNQRLRTIDCSASAPSIRFEHSGDLQQPNDGRYRQPISGQSSSINKECSQVDSTAGNERLTANATLVSVTNWPTAGENGSDCAYATGANLRCKCAGTRKKTLAGLIELFEQKIRVCEQSLQPAELLAEQRISSPSPLEATEGGRIKHASGANVNKQTTTMRDIITPVNYDRCSLKSSTSFDSSAEQSVDEHQQQAALHHTSIKGVPVLPSKSGSKQPNLRQLTRTRWQPPTDGRQYETGYSRKPSPTISVAKCCQAASAASRGPTIVKHQASSSRRLLSQLAKLRRLSEPNYKVKRPERVAQVESLIEQLERATAEWEEDEHLLERAERRDWPTRYHERFPSWNEEEAGSGERISKEEETARRRGGVGITKEIHEKQVDFGCRADVDSFEESSIARSHLQLMEVYSSGSRSASSTLQRRQKTRPAARPSAFADRYHDDLAVRRLSQSPRTMGPEGAGRYHSNAPQMSYLLCSNAYTPSIEGAVEPYLAALERRVQQDDLHFRNLRRKLDPHEPPFGIPRQQTGHSSASHYLRCRWQQDDGDQSRASDKDRSTIVGCNCTCVYQQATAADFDETPFGRRSDSRVSFAIPNRREHTSIADKTDDSLAPGDRLDGCASADSGLVVGANTPSSPIQADGVHQSASSKLSQATSASPATTLTVPQKAADERGFNDDVKSRNIELEEEQEKEVLDELMSKQLLIEPRDERTGSCESPAPERHLAQFRATPVRCRPKINIENPRAKSPLLRPKDTKKPDEIVINGKDVRQTVPVKIQCYSDSLRRSSRQSGSTARAMGELECSHDFEDDGDD